MEISLSDARPPSLPQTSPEPYIDKGKRPAYSEILKYKDDKRKPQNAQMRTRLSDSAGQDQHAKPDPLRPRFLKAKKRFHNSSSSTAIYLAGMPEQEFHLIKQTFREAPISLHLGYIRNLSFIDGRILEILVDTNHVETMRNRLRKYSPYKVRNSFDPLSPESFDWEGDIVETSKVALLKRKLVARLAVSIASTNKPLMRNHIMGWATNRGVEDQLNQELRKKGIIVTDDSMEESDKSTKEERDKPEGSAITHNVVHVTAGAHRFSKHKRGYTSPDNIHGYDMLNYLFLLCHGFC